MPPAILFRAAAVVLIVAAIASGADAQPVPVAHPVGRVLATSAEPLRAVIGVRALSNGRVLVNDIASRRLVMLDSLLGNPVIVADSVGTGSTAYGGRIDVLVAYRGDSTLLIDPTTPAMLVIDPEGRLAGVRAFPRAQDATALATAALTGVGAAFDARGRMLYRAIPRAAPPPRPAPGAPIVMPQQPDSAPLVRVDLATRALDTVAFVRVMGATATMKTNPAGGISISMAMNPLPVVDEWAVLADGSVAIVRGQDYHVDWIDPDGTTRRSTAKLPFDWQRLTEADKAAIIDSARMSMQRMAQLTQAIAGGADPARAAAALTTAGDSSTAKAAPPPTGPVQLASTGSMTSLMDVVPVDKLPDYRPPFTPGAVMADADGNLWIRLGSQPRSAGFIYDVVNESGVLVDRVQLPPNSTLAGFSPGGIVFFGGLDVNGYRLVKALVR